VWKNFLLISNLNLPCLSLRPFPLVLSLSTLINSCSPFCFVLVSPEPSLFQAKQAQFPQPFLIGEVLQPSDHLSGPSLDLLLLVVLTTINGVSIHYQNLGFLPNQDDKNLCGKNSCCIYNKHSRKSSFEEDSTYSCSSIKLSNFTAELQPPLIRTMRLKKVL